MLACARLGLAARGGVRRVLRGGAAVPDRRRAGPGGDHRRWAVPPRHRRAAEGRRRRSRRRRGFTRWSTCWWSAAPGSTSPGPDKDLWWDELVDAQSDHPHPGGVPGRATAVRAVHLRHHRETQGHRAHLAVGTSPRPRTPTTPCSTTNPAPTCTGAPPISAGSPGTPTSSTGRWRTGPPRSSTRAPRTPRTRAGTGRSSTNTGCRSTTPRRR